MKIAVLDLGTNTFHLLIVEVGGDKTIKTIFKSRIVVKLGEGAIHRHVIAAAPYRRGLDALIHYAQVIRELKPDRVTALATSAIRGATNGKKFVNEVKRKTGISIKAIPGTKEAELIWNGVRHCVPMTNEKQLIMDIGGGSTEFIIGNQSRIFWKRSFNIGVARLLELFKPGNPVTLTEINVISKHLISILRPLDRAMSKFPVRSLVGSSGSFDTLAEMIGWKYRGRDVLKGICSYSFDPDQLSRLHTVLLKSTTVHRMRMKGLVKMRVDTIVLASLCIQLVLARYGLTRLTLSKYALKEGALWNEMERLQSGR